MRPLSSVHTHSILCDGRDTLEEMAAGAWAAGVRVFGASGHVHTPMRGDQGNVLDADMGGYRAEVLRLRGVYEGRMEVLLGIEWDSQSDVSWGVFDYWIGSVHHLASRGSGADYCVDWSRESLAACRDEACGGDFLRVAAWYYRDVAAVAAKKPTILGHVDLITKLNGDGAFFEESDPRYRALALEALHAADPAATLLEINTGAMQRGYRTAPYPADFLLSAWREMGGEVILTADAHSVAGIVYAYEEAAAFARAAGYREQAFFTRSGRQTAAL